MQRLMDLDPPPLSEKDYVEQKSREWRMAVRYYNTCKAEKELAEKFYEESRKELIRLSGDHNSRGEGLRVTRSLRRGQIDYSQIPEIKEMDLEPYRKGGLITWRISEEKDYLL